MHKTLVAILLLLLLFAGTAAANPNDGVLHQINSTHWYFETTQTSLADGEYNYQAFANNISSDYRILEVNTAVIYSIYLSALAASFAGNSITTTTTCADASWSAATLTGGSDSDSEWAESDVPTGVSIWRDGAGMIAIAVLALLAGVVIVFLRDGGGGTEITISPNIAISLAVGLLVLLAVFSIGPIFGDRIDSVSDLGRETHATGRLTFALDGTTADGETVTINATTLEFDRSADGVTAGRVPVNISDGTAATASLNLTAAINGNATLAAVVAARRDVS